jgi:hypothetical protein
MIEFKKVTWYSITAAVVLYLLVAGLFFAAGYWLGGLR